MQTIMVAWLDCSKQTQRHNINEFVNQHMLGLRMPECWMLQGQTLLERRWCHADFVARARHKLVQLFSTQYCCNGIPLFCGQAEEGMKLQLKEWSSEESEQSFGSAWLEQGAAAAQRKSYKCVNKLTMPRCEDCH